MKGEIEEKYYNMENIKKLRRILLRFMFLGGSGFVEYANVK